MDAASAQCVVVSNELKNVKNSAKKERPTSQNSSNMSDATNYLEESSKVDKYKRSIMK
jgi:hypothetical protein